MQISAVLLARSIALFDTADLNPRGKVFLPKLIPLLAERFSFQTIPVKPEELDESKGVAFRSGYFEGQTISELTFYNDGIKVDLQSSTEEGQSFIHQTLHWLSEETGLVYSDGMIKRWGLLSQLTFHSDMDMDGIHPAFRTVADEVTTLVSARTGLPLTFRTSGLSFNFERVNGDIPIATFSIERRAKSLHSENKYFSQAPIQTTEHIRILTELEKSIESR